MCERKDCRRLAEMWGLCGDNGGDKRAGDVDVGILDRV